VTETIHKLLLDYSPAFGVVLSKTEIQKFLEYYELIQDWNRKINLTRLESPADFARFHILESCLIPPRIEADINSLVDLGSGAGLPGIPIAIMRPLLMVSLIESNLKKAIFLKEVCRTLRLENVEVIRNRFENLESGRWECLTTRAIESFSQMLPHIERLSSGCRQVFLLCNPELASLIEVRFSDQWMFHQELVPESRNRILVSLTALQVSRETAEPLVSRET